jgi:hypothetical protein
MLAWVILILLISLLCSFSYREHFTSGKDELSIPGELANIKIQDFQSFLDAGVFWKDVNMVRLQELLNVLDSPGFNEIMQKDQTHMEGLKEDIRRQRGKEFLDLFQVKFYDDYRSLLDIYDEIDRISGTKYMDQNTTIEKRHEYYSNFDTSKNKDFQVELTRLKNLLKETIQRGNSYSLYNNAKYSYRTLAEFYKSGFKVENAKVVPKIHDLNIIYRIPRTSFIVENKQIILKVLQKRLIQERNDSSTNAFAFAKKNALEIQPEASLSFFSNIMDKLNLLEKKEFAPVFTNKHVDMLAVDRYLEPSCNEGESLFCSGEITCTDIYGNEIPNMMKSEENASYTSGRTHSNCGSYNNRVEYKDWIGSLSKNLVGSATEIITYDISNCTIMTPWKLTTNSSCYLTVEKAQDAFLNSNTKKNELLLGSIVLVETIFMEDFFDRNSESIFNLNHPKENIQIQRLKYKGNMQLNETSQDIDQLKKLPKVWVNQTTYYKAKIVQINKDAYDLIIPDDYGIKVNGIKKEFLFMPDVSYLKVLNETLTDATVNSMPRPSCSGSFSKCSKTPKIEYDPSDTLKKNLIHQYEKAAPYLLTSAEVSDSCPSTVSLTSSHGFSLF